MAAKKATIYLDTDDDITAVIDHLKGAPEQIVALVVPKRAEVLNSLVNMKLLKRSATQLKKQVVLITDNSAISRIAGATGVYVASSLRSKPQIPVNSMPAIDKSKTVAEHQQEAGKVSDDIANETNEESTELGDEATSKTPKKKKPSIKVPNFDAFRVKIALIALAVLLLPIGWFIAFRVLPKATIRITTNATNLPASVELTTTSDLEGLDLENKVIPVSIQENKQQYAEEYEATGEKQVGEKASGLMTISNCKKDDSAATIPAGTVFTSGNLRFVSAVAVNLEPGDFTGSGNCQSTGDHVKTITVSAIEPGDQYNLSSRSYNIEGVNSQITAFGGDMSGGSNEVVTVVSQQDIDSALQRLNAKIDEDSVRSQLRNTLQTAGFVPIDDTFSTIEGDPIASAQVDDETAGGTLTLNTTYTMAGVRETDVLDFLVPILEEQAGELQLIDSGIAAARYTATKLDGGGYAVTIKSNGVAGLLLDQEQVFDEIKGKKTDEAAANLRSREGITQVEASSSPFWNTSIPTNRKKVIIEINGQ